MKKMKLIKRLIFLLIVFGGVAAPLAAFSADGSKSDTALAEPVRSVLDHYLIIQKELAKDSMKGVDEHANSIAKVVRADESKILSPEVAKQAEAVAKAKDIKTARQAFKPLSASLVKYVADNKVAKGTYHEAYCPMARASWL